MYRTQCVPHFLVIISLRWTPKKLPSTWQLTFPSTLSPFQFFGRACAQNERHGLGYAFWNFSRPPGSLSPLSHARERRGAKRSGGKESGEEASRKWAHFLVSRLRHSFSRSRLRRARLCSNVSLLAGYLLPSNSLSAHKKSFHSDFQESEHF